MCFFSFLLISTPPIFKRHNFLISYSFKVLLEHHLNSTNHFWILIATKQHTRNFLGVQELIFVAFNHLFISSFWPPLLLGAIVFSIIFHLTIFNVPYVSTKGVQVLFKHQKWQIHPLGFCLPWAFKCLVTSQFALFCCNSICN
jgi:hypothetical protein